MSSSFIYLYLRQNQVEVFLMVLIYLIFRNVVEQPDSMINKTREPQLEMSRSVDSRCLFLPFEVIVGLCFTLSCIL